MDSTVAAVMLAFASGLSSGFLLGRVFERWEYEHKFRKFRQNHVQREEETL